MLVASVRVASSSAVNAPRMAIRSPISSSMETNAWMVLSWKLEDLYGFAGCSSAGSDS